jgi:hypothetical protein
MSEIAEHRIDGAWSTPERAARRCTARHLNHPVTIMLTR